MEDSVWHALAGPVPPPPLLEGVTLADACVVGLGGSGLAALKELTRRGVDAVAIDAGGVAAGAAGRNGGFLLAGLAHFHHDAVERLGRERAVACYHATASCLAEMIEETPSAVRRTGSLRIAVDGKELADCATQLRAMQHDGLPVEEWSGPEGEGLFFPGDCAFQPVERCRQLAAECLAAGARLMTASVTSLTDGRVVCRRGEVRARWIFVCVDGGLAELVPSVGSLVRSARLQMAATESIRARLFPRPVYRRYGFDYYQQLPSGELVVGGGRDIGGATEWTSRLATTEVVQEAIDRIVRDVSGSEVRVARRWAGIVGYTESGLPVVRPLSPGVFAAGGYCGTGNVVGRLAARALVSLALDRNDEMARLLDLDG